MLNPTDLKKGIVIQLDGQPFKVTDYSQKVMGRGGSIVSVRLKNLLTGAAIPKTFKGAEKIEPAEVTYQKAQYLYGDGQEWHFMNPETFEQFALSKDLSSQAAPYLKEGDEVDLQSFNGTITSVELPKNLYLKVTYSESVVKGDTTSNVQKDATLETGLIVKVPAFIKTGDVIKVDTRTGQYLERKKD